MLSRLKSILGDIASLSITERLLCWDEETLMPRVAVSLRSQQMETLSRIRQGLWQSPELSDCFSQALEALGKGSLSPQDSSYVSRMKRHYELQALIPVDLEARLAKLRVHAREAWLKARDENDFSLFQGKLADIMGLLREKVAIREGSYAHPYDACLDIFEEGLTTEIVDEVFSNLSPKLIPLVSQASELCRKFKARPFHQYFPLEKQKALSSALLKEIGFSFDSGILDESAHPFCMGLGSQDVRLANRYNPGYLLSSVYGALHEGGHGLYEQGIEPALDGTLLGGGQSLVIHESQSRFWENIVGRSRGFWERYTPLFKSFFPEQLYGYSAEDLYRASNIVQPSFIRVEADELTYHSHVIIRYELEKALFSNDIDVRDIPEAWRTAYEKHLGICPPDDNLGCLQDVHWCELLVGYFPTYSLGSLFANQVCESMESDIGKIADNISSGDFTAILDWQREHIHRYGSSRSPQEIITSIAPEGLNSQAFLAYSEEKYLSF